MRDVLQRARAKIWSLVKCRDAGASKEQLVSLYISRVRSTLEYACQVYDPLINESQSLEIEAVQRNCLQIIMGVSSRSYNSNLSSLGLSSLAARRIVLVRQFAISCYRSPNHRWWFTLHPALPLGTRYRPPRFLVPKCKLQRDHKRPIVAYSEVLNGLSDEEWVKLKLPPVSLVRHASNQQLSDLSSSKLPSC